MDAKRKYQICYQRKVRMMNMHGSPTDNEMAKHYARQELQPDIKRLLSRISELELQLEERTKQLHKAIADLNKLNK